MYSTDESMENAQFLLVGMHTADVVFISMLEDCKEVYNVNICCSMCLVYSTFWTISSVG